MKNYLWGKKFISRGERAWKEMENGEIGINKFVNFERICAKAM
jgi:hypothetical protein